MGKVQMDEFKKRPWMRFPVQVILIIQVFCKLCGLAFKKEDACKVLTNKLIWELVILL
jgi:hypothetical protein